MSELMEDYNGYPIKNIATARRLEAYIQPSRETAEKEAPQMMLKLSGKQGEQPIVMAGDASAVATCALQVKEGADYFNQNILQPQERQMSSGQRELLTILKALRQDNDFFASLRNETILWLTDSTNLVSFLTKGTMKKHIQEQVLEVFSLLATYKIRLVPVHLRRTDFRIQWADEGSREFDPDDWGIDRGSYRELTKSWQPTVDLFAHSSNAKSTKFYSYGNAPYSAGVDAFAQDWTDEIAWACPPVYLVADTLKKIENTRMMAILTVPAWRSAPFWPVLFPDGQRAVTSCVSLKLFHPHVIRGKFCQNKLMQGRTSFPFLAIYLRSTGEGHSHESGKCRVPSSGI